MSGFGLELWLAFLAAALALAGGAFYLARKDDSVDWDTDRRDDPRRSVERRGDKERRSLSRLLHDRLHNHSRRRAERREQERRRYGEWKKEIEEVRARVENVKQDNQQR
jgi:hypothetical protein